MAVYLCVNFWDFFFSLSLSVPAPIPGCFDYNCPVVYLKDWYCSASSFLLLSKIALGIQGLLPFHVRTTILTRWDFTEHVFDPCCGVYFSVMC